MDSKKYDYIVIGGGIGGMTAGAMLAKKKKRVLVLERYSIIGGCAQYFRRKGYRFDVSLHQIGSVHNGFNKQMLVDAGVYDRLKFIKLKDLYISHFSDIDLKVELPNADLKGIRKKLLDLFPKEKKGLDTWIWWLRFGGRQIQFFDNRFKNLVRRVLTEFTAPLTAPFAVFGNMLKYKFALRHIKDRKLYNIVNQLWGYYGLPAAQSNMQFNTVANYGYYVHGGYYVEGGGYQICDEMRKVIEENGGTVMVNADVKKIHTYGRQVVGVQLANKQNFFAKHILSNASPAVTYKMLNEKPDIATKLAKVKSKIKSISCSVLYLGLKKPIGDLNPDLKDKYEIFVNNSTISEDEQYRNMMDENYERDLDRETFAITMHSNVDPTQNSADKSVLNVFVPDILERWDGLSREEYKAKKTVLTEKMMTILKRYVPDIENYIEVSELATPLTVRRFTNNPGGSIYGYSQHVAQAGLRRTGIVKSPYKNLHFCSAWGFPGGGYEGSMRGAAYVVKSLLTNKWLYGLTWAIWLIIFISLQVLPNL